MCVVSNLGDYAKDSWPKKYPNIIPNYIPPTHVPWNPFNPSGAPAPVNTGFIPMPTDVVQQQIDELRKEFEAMKEMLKAAKIYDERFNEPECELDEKVEFLKKVAELVGVDLEDIFERKTV